MNSDQITFANYVDDLRKIGLKQGDIVLARASLRELGPVNYEHGRANLVIDALMSVLGDSGLLLGLSFSRNDRAIRLTKLPPYSPAESTNTGGLASAMLGREGAVRSAHPTNSFVGIGKDAANFLRGHDHTAACFAPVEKLIEANGKMLLIGCETSSPGFSTVHLSQHTLGLDTRTWIAWVLGRRYVDHTGAVCWYQKKDVPGCSMGFGKFYDLYRAHGALHEGKIGYAHTMLIDARAASNIELDALRANPEFALCSRDDCLVCRIGWFYKDFELIRYAAAKIRKL